MTFHRSCRRGCAGAVRKGPAGHPVGRRRGSRNKATLAAAALLASESEALTRKAVEMALAGDRPRCGSAWNACCGRTGNAPSNSVVRAIEIAKKEGSRLNLPQILATGNYDEDNSEGNSGGDNCEETGDYHETDGCDS
jgi:hypothetical protein